jgi:hypothetical protein
LLKSNSRNQGMCARKFSFCAVQENAGRTSAFVVLIRLLQPLDPSRWPSPASRDVDAIRSHKFSDLVVKCLIKLTKVINWINSLFFVV